MKADRGVMKDTEGTSKNSEAIKGGGGVALLTYLITGT